MVRLRKICSFALLVHDILRGWKDRHARDEVRIAILDIPYKVTAVRTSLLNVCFASFQDHVDAISTN
jgi:hypothetical protein